MRRRAKWKRRHDRPQTAYQRLLSLEVLSSKNERRLRDQYASLDPFVLHGELERRLAGILKHTVREDGSGPAKTFQDKRAVKTPALAGHCE